MRRERRVIISASRRTDVPAFYSEWFMNRIRAGYCVVPNPMYPQQKTKPISLKPEDVEIIVFWTRDPAPLIKYLPELDERGYTYYFQYTLLGYPRVIDPRCPEIEKAIETFSRLSDLIGKEKVLWRYDPILFSNLTPLEWHKDQIGAIAEKLKGKTAQLVISLIDPYRKTKIRLERETGDTFSLDGDAFEPGTYTGLAEWLGPAMKKIGLRVNTCAERIDLSLYGIEHGKCIDDELIRRIIKSRENDLFGASAAQVTHRKDPAQREHCGCIESRDIGMNNTCMFGCKYCYATGSEKMALRNYEKHDKKAEAIIDLKMG